MTNLWQRLKDSKATMLLIVMRPQQWFKNTFVLAPLLFSAQFTQPVLCLKAILAFISYCAASSTIYAINDVCDRREDQQHPVKKHRPIASGAIKPSTAILLGIVLIVFSLITAWCLNWCFVLIVLIYIITTIAYSLALKHMAILDVMTISIGFVLRVLGGSIAISVTASYWLILCTILISMFLGFTKRRAELLSTSSQLGNFRLVLKDYSITFLDQAISLVTGATIVCYAIYTVDERTRQTLGTDAMLITVPFVIYGLLRYVYIIYHLKEGENPSGIILRDGPMIINLVIWVLVSLLVVAYGSGFYLFSD